MINIKVNNLNIKAKIKWKNSQEIANECITTILQVLCNVDKAVNEQLKDTRDEFRHQLSNTLIRISNDFKDDNMHEYYSERTRNDEEQPEPTSTDIAK